MCTMLNLSKFSTSWDEKTMTNEEPKKKIIEILEETECEWTEEKNGYILQIFYDKLADVLIAAGYGDVSEYKEKLKLHRVFVRKDGGDIKVLYGNNEVDEIVKERNEYKHRAARAERALKNACEDVKKLVSFLIKLSERVDSLRVEGYLPEESEPKAYINRAEKELAEERKDD